MSCLALDFDGTVGADARCDAGRRQAPDRGRRRPAPGPLESLRTPLLVGLPRARNRDPLRDAGRPPAHAVRDAPRRRSRAGSSLRGASCRRPSPAPASRFSSGSSPCPIRTRAGEGGTLISERLVAAAPELAAELATPTPRPTAAFPRLDLLPEALVGRELARCGLFAEFANHFLVAAAPAPLSAGSATWSRLRPPAPEVAWHYAAGRREPIATVFELEAAGAGRIRSASAGWTTARRCPTRGVLLGGAGEVAARSRRIRSGCGWRSTSWRAGAAPSWTSSQLLRLRPGAIRPRRATSQARRSTPSRATPRATSTAPFTSSTSSGGRARACRSPGGSCATCSPASRCAARRSRTCRTAARSTRRSARALGVEPSLAADLAREADLGAAVRAAAPEMETRALAAALERPWPVPVALGLDAGDLGAAAASSPRSIGGSSRTTGSWSPGRLDLQADQAAQFEEASRRLETPSRRNSSSALQERDPGIETVTVAGGFTSGMRHRRVRACAPSSCTIATPSCSITVCARRSPAPASTSTSSCSRTNAARHFRTGSSTSRGFTALASPGTIGFGEANNRAVAWSRRNLPPVEGYFFLNNDAVVRHDTLERLASVLREQPGRGSGRPADPDLGSRGPPEQSRAEPLPRRRGLGRRHRPASWPATCHCPDAKRCSR